MAEQSNIPDTLQLSIKICGRLPRELRDRIYSFLDLSQENERIRPIDDFVSDRFCEQFSRECLLWYYENVPQMLCRRFRYEDIEYFMQLYPKGKKMPGLTIVLGAAQPDFEFEYLTTAMDKFKATGYFDDLNRDFKVRVYIDITLHYRWSAMNPNAEKAVVFSQRILEYFRTRIEDASCFLRLMDANDKDIREVGVDITKYIGEPVDDILQRFLHLIIIMWDSSPPRWIEQSFRMAERKKELLQKI